MSRQIRKLKPAFMIFCEGDTEYHYFSNIKKNPNIRLSIKPINMHGGGYSGFLEKIKESENTNYLAKFVIIDLDLIFKNQNEKKKLEELISYCKNQNKSQAIPIFLIIDNPDFEYIACLHIPSYKNSNTKVFIEKNLNFKNLSKFKSNKEIYSI
jgi:hypothetical protein